MFQCVCHLLSIFCWNEDERLGLSLFNHFVILCMPFLLFPIFFLLFAFNQRLRYLLVFKGCAFVQYLFVLFNRLNSNVAHFILSLNVLTTIHRLYLFQSKYLTYLFQVNRHNKMQCVSHHDLIGLWKIYRKAHRQIVKMFHQKNPFIYRTVHTLMYYITWIVKKTDRHTFCVLAHFRDI